MSYQEAGLNLGKLVGEKQKAYGDAITGVNEILIIMYPEGIKPEQYRDVGLIVRVLDKLLRISRGDKDAFGESPWHDIAGYGLLGGNEKSKVMVKGEGVYVENEEKTCGNCKDNNTSAYSEPCKSCIKVRDNVGISYSSWQPIEEGSEDRSGPTEAKEQTSKSCHSCKYLDISAYKEPCRTCWNKRNWQPKKEGSE